MTVQASTTLCSPNSCTLSSHLPFSAKGAKVTKVSKVHMPHPMSPSHINQPASVLRHLMTASESARKTQQFAIQEGKVQRVPALPPTKSWRFRGDFAVQGWMLSPPEQLRTWRLTLKGRIHLLRGAHHPSSSIVEDGNSIKSTILFTMIPQSPSYWPEDTVL